MADISKLLKFERSDIFKTISTIEMHTCGEPLRVFTEGIGEIPGHSILEKRRYFMENLDHIRTATMFEPRGHADMYGAIITQPVSEGSDFGTFFMHNEGYSTMCGHAIIALVKLALESGLVDKEGDTPGLRIDAPPGIITAVANRTGGVVASVSFRNVPSFVILRDKYIDLPGVGKVRFDVSFGGAFYALVEAADLDLRLDPSDYPRIIDYGKRIKQAVIENFTIEHPFEKELSFLYGTIFTGPAHNPENWSRNVCVFANGEVDRSPTGSGVSARAALHYLRGELEIARRVTIESIIGTTMDLEVVDTVEYGGLHSVVPEVSGTASFTGRNQLWLDSEDPLVSGFILR